MKTGEYVREQIAHRETDAIPYALPMEEDLMIRLDDYYGSTLWRNTIKSFFSIHNLVSYHPVDPDGSTNNKEGQSQDLYGGIWRVDGNINHHISVPLPEPSVKGFSFFDPEIFLSADVINKTTEAVRNTDEYSIINLGAGIWEICWHMRGFENALTDTLLYPNFFAELCEIITDQIIKYIDKVKDIPVDAIYLGDDWGEQRGVLLGVDNWRKYIKPGWKRIVEAVHKSDKKIFNHCCGSMADLIPDMIDIGLDVIESVQPEAAGNDPYLLKQKYGRDITFWGGLGSQSIIPYGTPNELTAEINKLINEMGKGGGYLLEPAKGLMNDTPTENAAAIIEAFTAQKFDFD